jgi:hypothetical protein
MPLRKNLVEDLMSAIEGIVERPQFPPPPNHHGRRGSV